MMYRHRNNNKSLKCNENKYRTIGSVPKTTQGWVFAMGLMSDNMAGS